MRDRTGVLVALGGCAAVLSAVPGVVRFEEAVGLRWLYEARGVVRPPEGAVVIVFDEDSAAWLQRNSGRLEVVAPLLGTCLGAGAGPRLAAMRSASEIPRDVFACLIDTLAEQGPRLIVLDVYFTVAQLEDTALAASIARAGNVLLLERVVERPAREASGLPLVLRNRPVEALERAALGTVSFLVESGPGAVTLRYVTRTDPFPDLPVMPVEAYRRMTGAVPPLAAREAFRLYGPEQTVPTRSVREIMETPAARPLALGGRVVFVGGAGSGPAEQRDSFAIPAFSPRLSGVELAATAYLNLTEGRGLRTPGAAGRAALAAAVVSGLAAAALFLPRRLAVAGAIGFAAAVGAAAFAFFRWGVWLPVAMPLSLGLVAAGLVGLERRRRFARRIATALLPAPLSVRLFQGRSAAPRTQTATALFADLAGSTGLAENCGPDGYARIMADYYNLVTEAVDHHGGAVYKYEGDGVLALFSSGGGRPDARRAVDAAFGIASAMAAGRLSGAGVRIGIATGPVAVGMIRFGEHASIATMGDAVHRAYRLQEAARDLGQVGPGVVTLIDDAAAAAAGADAGRMRFLASLTLRGRSTPTDVYRLTS